MSQDKKDWDIVEFGTQVSKLIESNFKAVLAVCVIAIVGSSVWAYTTSVAREKEKAAFGELYKITKVYQKKKTDFADAKEAKTKKPEAKAKEAKTADTKKENKNLIEATGDINKDYPEVVKNLESFLKANLGRNASGEAALFLSEVYAEYGKAEKGAEAVALALSQWTDKNVLYYVMQMRSGDLWATVNQCDKAASFWEVVANSKSFISQQAQLKLGVCLQEIGEIERAKWWFERITDLSPNSAEGFSAKRYLRFLQFKTKTGSGAGADKAQQKDSKQDSPS